MMPVFTHPRCANCHGLTDPIANVNHGGGAVDPASQSCMDGGCHTDAKDWKLAVNPFVRQTAKDLCQFMAGTVVPNKTPAGFIAHLQTDELIKLAFVGEAGGARDTRFKPADPPPPGGPGGHGAFVAAAQSWIDNGLAMCDREGAISHTEELSNPETFSVGPKDTARVVLTGKREVTVRFVNGGYEAVIQAKGSITKTMTVWSQVNNVPCSLVYTTTTDYADVDTPTNLVPTNGGIRSPAKVQVSFQPSGRYTITVDLPGETHRQVDQTIVGAGCGTGLTSPAQTVDQTPAASTFVIHGQLPSSAGRTQLVGRESHTVKGPTAQELPWLTENYPSGDKNGNMVPVKITNTWNLQYHP
jgi:hypothetical protein